ncbi:MAG: hypothetical protein L6Q47_11470 [Ignavibacteriaceae bacterium]|nr:hypothetical protein [Ignavibacteriaceae bacterium]
MSHFKIIFGCRQCEFNQLEWEFHGITHYYYSSSVPIRMEVAKSYCLDCEKITWSESFPEYCGDNKLETEFEYFESLCEKRRKAIEHNRTLLDRITRRLIFKKPYSDVIYNDLKSRCDELDILLEDKRRKNFIALTMGSRKPKCLKCGGTSIVVLPEYQGLLEYGREFNVKRNIGFLHPICGGDIFILQEGTRGTMMTVNKYYDLDGNFIKRVED